MQKTNQVVTIFFSTTADSQYAYRRKSLDRAIKGIEEARNVAIKVLDWQKNIPGGVSGATGQERLDREVYDTFDIYFGCLGTKFGEGTVREFELAIQGHIERGRPAEVLFAFDETKVNPFEIPAGFDRVIDFRHSLHSEEKYGRSITYFTFDNQNVFYDRLFRDLNSAVRVIQTKIRGGPPPVF